MAETVLVTGGSGFVAGWCIVELLKRGYAVRATLRSLEKADGVRRDVASQVDPQDRLSFVVADMEAEDGWAEAMAGCAYVLHVASPFAAAEDSVAMVETARDGTLRVLRAATAAGVTRVVMTSSTAACDTPLQGRTASATRRSGRTSRTRT